MRGRTRVGIALLLCSAAGATGGVAEAVAQPAGTLAGPRVVARGVGIALTGTGFAPATAVAIEHRRGGRWRQVATTTADAQGRIRLRLRPKRPRPRFRLRARARDLVSREVVVRTRAVTLAAVGDINLGDGVASVMARRGFRFPWSGVAPVLRRTDVAFGNLECSVSTRGRPVPKEFNFRGRPEALRTARRYAGLDVLNLANNHVGDYGTAALRDTIDYTRRFGMEAVGAGRNLADAGKPRVVERLGLRIGFVGFSDILPRSFAAGRRKPGTVFASTRAIRRGVRAARRRSDVVVATFHWGVERDMRESESQRRFARTALAAGAHAVIGAHPHVLQPIRMRGRRVVAYSLGNFVWAAGSGVTSRTGILVLGLSARGVESRRFRRARIEGTRPRLVSRGGS